MNILLFQPQIPQNTGNIVRTCAVTGSKLFLVKPLGFSVTNRWLKRAGLDYWEGVEVNFIDDLNEFLENTLCSGQKFASRGERGKTESHRPSKGIAESAIAEKEVLFGEAAAAHGSEFLSSAEENADARFFFYSSHAKKAYTEIDYEPEDFLIFGSETSGLPQAFWEKWPEHFYTIPKRKETRCLNLANAVSIVLYEAWRQQGFAIA